MSKRFVVWTQKRDDSGSKLMQDVHRKIKDNQGENLQLIRISGSDNNIRRVLVESKDDFLFNLLDEHKSDIEIEEDSEIFFFNQ